MNPFSFFSHPAFVKTFNVIVFDLWPIWLPAALLALFYHLWFEYKRLAYVSDKEPVLLEIRLPAEVFKSPRAMEVVIMALYQTGGPNLTDVYLDGAVKPWFSLELVSQGGNIRFFVWTWSKYRQVIENQLYSQYPDVEVHVAEDYAHEITHNPEERMIWGAYFKVADEVKPLKTYVDYELEKDPKEEFKIDPMTAVLEYLGALSPGEQAWYQILIQAHLRKENWEVGEFFARDRYNKKIDDYIEGELSKRTLAIQPQKPPGIKEEDFKPFNFTPLFPGTDKLIEKLDKFKTQYQFETMIRTFYIAEEGYFNASNITGMIGSFKQYGYQDPANSIRLGWWTDFRDSTKNYLRFLPESWYMWKRAEYERSMLKAYKLRSFFQPPYKNHSLSFSGMVKPFVMTTEELATMFHIPGGVAQTPTMQRIDSKKAEPPTNLPT